MMEHTIASNISKHRNNHNGLYELQHGFREKSSCKILLNLQIEDLAIFGKVDGFGTFGLKQSLRGYPATVSHVPKLHFAYARE